MLDLEKRSPTVGMVALLWTGTFVMMYLKRNIFIKAFIGKSYSKKKIQNFFKSSDAGRRLGQVHLLRSYLVFNAIRKFTEKSFP